MNMCPHSFSFSLNVDPENQWKNSFLHVASLYKIKVIFFAPDPYLGKKTLICQQKVKNVKIASINIYLNFPMDQNVKK